MEFIARALPEERIWLCDSCGTDVACRGIIDMEGLKVQCKDCYQGDFHGGPAR